MEDGKETSPNGTPDGTQASDIEQALARVMSKVEEDRRREQQDILNELKIISAPPQAPAPRAPADDLPDPNLEFEDYMKQYRNKVTGTATQEAAAMIQYAQIAKEDADMELTKLVDSGLLTAARKTEVLRELSRALMDDPQSVVANVKNGHHLSFVARLTHDDIVENAKSAKAKLGETNDPITSPGTGSIASGGGGVDPARQKLIDTLKERGLELDPSVKEKWGIS